jgi:hypothetical protein
MVPILSWNPPGFEAPFALHDERGPLRPQVNDPTIDPCHIWEDRIKPIVWELNFFSTYLMHSFKPRGQSLPGFEGITVEYLLARNSNHALAAYLTVQQCLRMASLRKTTMYMEKRMKKCSEVHDCWIESHTRFEDFLWIQQWQWRSLSQTEPWSPEMSSDRCFSLASTS